MEPGSEAYRILTLVKGLDVTLLDDQIGTLFELEDDIMTDEQREHLEGVQQFLIDLYSIVSGVNHDCA